MEPYGIGAVRLYVESQIDPYWMRVDANDEPMSIPTESCFTLGTTPDGLLISKNHSYKIPIEVKAPFRGFEATPYLNQERPTVPCHYYIQMQAQMKACSAPYGILCIIDVDEFIILRVPFNEAAWQFIEDQVINFLRFCVRQNGPFIRTVEQQMTSNKSYFSGKDKRRDLRKIQDFQDQTPNMVLKYQRNIFY